MKSFAVNPLNELKRVNYFNDEGIDQNGGKNLREIALLI